jgi:hypothetical protein
MRTTGAARSKMLLSRDSQQAYQTKLCSLLFPSGSDICTVMRVNFCASLWLFLSLSFCPLEAVLAAIPSLSQTRMDAILKPLEDLPEGSGSNAANSSAIEAATRQAHSAFTVLQREAGARYKLKPRQPTGTEVLTLMTASGNENVARTLRMLRATDAMEAINSGLPPTSALFEDLYAQNSRTSWDVGGDDFHEFKEYFSVGETREILHDFALRLDRARVRLWPPVEGNPPMWIEFRLAKLSEEMRGLIVRLPAPVPAIRRPIESQGDGSELTNVPSPGISISTDEETELRDLYAQLFTTYGVILLRSTGAEHELESVEELPPQIVWERIQTILISRAQSHPVCSGSDEECIEQFLTPHTVEELKFAIQKLIKEIEHEMKLVKLEANELSIYNRARKIVKAGFPMQLLLEPSAPPEVTIRGPSTTIFRYGPQLNSLQKWLVDITANARARSREWARRSGERQLERLKARRQRNAQRQEARRERLEERERNDRRQRERRQNETTNRYEYGGSYTYTENPPSFFWDHGVPIMIFYSAAALATGLPIMVGGILLETVIPGGESIERALTPLFNFAYGFGSQGFDTYMLGGYILNVPLAAGLLIFSCIRHGEALENYEERRKRGPRW